MIIRMTKVRILGPRARHLDVVRALHDLGLVHLAGPCADERLVRAALSSARLRELRHLESVLHDIDAFLGDSSRGEKPAPRPSVTPGSREMAVWARTARRARREMDRLKERAAALGEERALVMKYRATFAAVEDLLRSRARWPNATAYYVVLRPSREDTVGKLRRLLAAVLGEAFELRAQTLPTGEVVLLILVPAGSAGRIDHVLAEARVQEIPVPPGYGGGSFAEAIPKMRERYEAIPKELQENAREQERLLETHRDDFVGARSAIHDLLMEMEAVPQSSLTEHAFVMEGWLPADALGRLRAILSRACGDVVDVEELDEEEWAAESAPVVLKNPRLLRPFEVLIRMVPMPRYGTIDPTPFVAVFFPMFVGLMVGDVAYGLALAVLSLVVRARSREGSLARSISEIAGACAAFTVAFGFLYGELLGDLGKRAFGMRPLLMDRQEAVLPYLGLAVSIGLVHVLLGLGLGVVNTMRRKPRQAVGRGASFVMVILIVLALFGATGVLPRAFFAPSVVAILVTFVVLVAVEGLIAPIELLTTLGNVLSYARVMALGTASVMLSVVANRMVGRVGSVVVGVVLALLFHLVNFALGLFSPTIHALRLHYVEFFGKFYSPGGVRYRPFGHWSARIGATPERSRP
jgi:V/A-type H+-transporting ATPase subunit I